MIRLAAAATAAPLVMGCFFTFMTACSFRSLSLRHFPALDVIVAGQGAGIRHSRRSKVFLLNDATLIDDASHHPGSIVLDRPSDEGEPARDLVSRQVVHRPAGGVRSLFGED